MILFNFIRNEFVNEPLSAVKLITRLNPLFLLIMKSIRWFRIGDVFSFSFAGNVD